jgi:hypothetical protein
VPHILEAARLPALYRLVCQYAGIPLSSAPPAADCFVLRSGAEPADLFAKLLEEASVEDEAEVALYGPEDTPPRGASEPGQVVVQAGFDPPCPDAESLGRAVQPSGGPVQLFAVERRDAGGRLLGVTWAAVPEEEPPPQAPFRAAVPLRDCRSSTQARPSRREKAQCCRETSGLSMR